MRSRAITLLPAILVGLCTLVPGDCSAQSLRLQSRPYQVGDGLGILSRTQSSTDSEMSMDGDSRSTRIEQKARERKRLTVESVSAGEPVRVRIEYEELRREVQMDGNDAPVGRRGNGGGRRGNPEGEAPEERLDPQELAGKQFILSLEGGTPSVTDGGGQAVSEAMANLVIGHEIKDGRIRCLGPDLSKALPDRDLNPGEALVFEGEAVQPFTTGLAFPELGDAKLTLTLEGARAYFGQNCAVFNVEMTGTSGPARRGGQGQRGGRRGPPDGGNGGGGRRMGGAEMPTTWKGKLIVGISDKRVREVKLEGSGESSSDMSRGERQISISSRLRVGLEFMALGFGKTAPKGP